MNKRLIKVTIFILTIIYIIINNINIDKQYNEYLKINNLNNAKLNYERFCEENHIFFAE